MTNDPNAFLMGTGAKSALFKKIGDRASGVIMHAELRQQTDFVSGALKFWDDGKPRMQLAVTLLTEDHDDDDDDGMRTVYVRGAMQKAVRDAILKSGARGLGDGGRLVVEYTGDAEATRPGMSGAKQFKAKYEPPVEQIPVSDDDDLPF